MTGTQIRDLETNETVDWAQIFFDLHKHCGLNKWEIFEYTLPQVMEFMKRIKKYIQFEVETRMSPMGLFGGMGGTQKTTDTDSDEGYEEIDEDGVMALARALGGG